MDWRILAIHESGKKNDISVTDRLARMLLGLDGGPGSGNFGHAGRPGKVGGSAKGEGSASGSGKEGSAASGNEKGASYEKAVSSFSQKSSPKMSEKFDIFSWEDPDDNEESNAKAAKQALERLSESYHMKGMVEVAKRSKGDYREFTKGMSKAQKQALQEQYKATGTSEHFTDYVKRMQKMLEETETVPPLVNKVVHGKDITADYEYKGAPPSEKPGTEEIDTQIEDVIHQQGFDGVPRLVSRKEFDQIVAENPQMPVLMRAYSAQNAETLDQYDEQLEGGHWYVDCGVGGAQYGQGMYCAGVYRDEDREIFTWDDPRILDPYYIGNDAVFKDKNGQGYVTKPVAQAENGDDLYVDQLYMYVDPETQKMRFIKRDMESLVWEDAKTGEMIEDSEVDHMVKTNDRIGNLLECKKTNLEGFENAAQKSFERGMEAAGKEMDHYLDYTRRRIMDNAKPQAPEGMSVVKDYSTDSYFYYDEKSLTAMGDKKPEDGSVIVLTAEGGSNPTLYYVGNGKLMSLDRMSNKDISLVSPDDKWAPMEGRCDDFNPVGAVRKMTLDPSAKIITHEELVYMRDGMLTPQEERDFSSSFFDEQVKGLGYGNDDLEYMKYAYEYPGYYTEYNPRFDKLDSKLDNDWKAFLDKMADDIRRKKSAAMLYEEEKTRERARRLNKFNDLGAMAAALGYDAINAQGHGATMSYTVVLNRTKLILQKGHA